MQAFQKRSIALSIILSLVTLGIYMIYWSYKITNEVHQAVGRKTTASGGLAVIFCIITFGIYAFYWLYRMGTSLSEALEVRAMRADPNKGLVYLILGLFGFGIVAAALLQDTLNDIADFDEAHGVLPNGAEEA